MNRLIFHCYLNPNYNDINNVNFIQIIIISPHFANNVDTISFF